jgi:hypothetical protein
VLWTGAALLGSTWVISANVTADDTVTVKVENLTNVTRTFIKSDTHVVAFRAGT